MDKTKFLSPIGMIEIYADDKFIVGINIIQGNVNNINFKSKMIEDIKKKETPILKKAKTQLKEYFEGKRKHFDLPIKLEGTDFQMKVWKELLKIPYGETRTYKEIAKKIDNPDSQRAVGNANNKNKIAIVIPCHRVVGSNGKLIGYALGLEKKKYLIELEKKYINKII